MSLRRGLMGFSALAVVFGALASFHERRLHGIALWGAALGILLLIERWRYRPTQRARQAGEVATGERFIDPETGALIEVVVDSVTGERRYVSVSGKSQAPER